MLSKAKVWKSLAIILTSLSVCLPAQAERIDEKPSAGPMFVDMVLLRPIYFVLSQAGAAIYTASLPFTLLSGDADTAAEVLVATPLQAAFTRCLGCGQTESDINKLSVEDGSKKIKHFINLNVGDTRSNAKAGDTNTIGYGVSAGTYFALSDGSRFEISLGAKKLGNFKDDDTDTQNDLSSYQVVSRFGRGFGHFDLMFKIGGHYWANEFSSTASPEAFSKDKFSGVSPLVGVGMDAWASNNIRLGIDYTHYQLKDGDFKVNLNTFDFNYSIAF